MLQINLHSVVLDEVLYTQVVVGNHILQLFVCVIELTVFHTAFVGNQEQDANWLSDIHELQFQEYQELHFYIRLLMNLY